MKMKELGEWYIQVIREAELADYGPSKGDIVLMPNGMSLWNSILSAISGLIEERGYRQAYFPLLIPREFIEREMKQFSSLSPRLYEARRANADEQESTMVIRPTSETVINSMFAKWIDSYRDLPMKVFQASNIVRWEEVTHPFLKSREILWLEGHTIHETEEQAEEEIIKMRNDLLRFFQTVLAIPVFFGVEPESRKFVGSRKTITFETIAPNGKALQIGALYDLGQVFSRMFSVQYRNRKNELAYCWGINWGIGFRLVGALALIHGDERGLVIPPRVAPFQAVILPVMGKNCSREELIPAIRTANDTLIAANVRTQVCTETTGSVKGDLVYWEKRGVPLIILVGKKEAEESCVTLLRRDATIGSNKQTVSIAQISRIVPVLLKKAQRDMFMAAQERINGLRCESLFGEALADSLENTWGVVYWCAEKACEQNVVNGYGKIIKCILPDEVPAHAHCVFCGKPACFKAVIAKTF